MDPEFPSPPVQGVSDLRACYDHALDVLVKAGADLDRVGTELNRVEVTFHNAVNEYLSQLQSQIDNKDKAIRLMVEQKVETIDVMCSMQNQLVKLQDENTMLKLDDVVSEVRDRTSVPVPSSTNYPALSHHTSPNHWSASPSNANHGGDTSETVACRTVCRDQERQCRDDEAFETWNKSTKHTCPEEIAAYFHLQDAREHKATVRERCDYNSGNAEVYLQDVSRQARERLVRTPASTHENEISSMIKEDTAHERLAEDEEARRCAWEAWEKPLVDTSPDATRAFLKATNTSDVLARRLPSIEMELSPHESVGQDSFQHESQPQVVQQQNIQQLYDQQQYAGELKAGPWAKYKQNSTTDAMESFRRQQAAHGWTVTTDDKRSRGSISKDTTKAIQPVGCELKHKAELESPPRNGHPVSVLNPRSPSFVPSNDKRGAAMTVRQTPPHRRLSKPDDLNAHLNTTSTIVQPAADNSNVKNKTSLPPHKRLPIAATAHKASTSVEIDLIALEDEIDPLTATRQYTFKATTRKDQTLASLDPNTPKPLPTVPKDSNGFIHKAPASSSLNELKELQIEATSLSPSYIASMPPATSIKKPSQVLLEHMHKQIHDSSGPPAQSSSVSISPPVVGNDFGTVPRLPLIVNAEGTPVQRASTLVLASSPVKTKINKLVDSKVNTANERRVTENSANSNFDTPFENQPSIMVKHNNDARAENEATTPVPGKAPTPMPPQHFNLAKDNKAMSAAFMAAAHSSFSAFATKYSKDSESDTRKELAAKGRALKEKLESEVSSSNVGVTLRMPEEDDEVSNEESDRPTIVGTHVLGEVLDPDSMRLVVKPNSRGEWFQMKLYWKPVVKDGRTCYILW